MAFPVSLSVSNRTNWRYCYCCCYLCLRTLLKVLITEKQRHQLAVFFYLLLLFIYYVFLSLLLFVHTLSFLSFFHITNHNFLFLFLFNYSFISPSKLWWLKTFVHDLFFYPFLSQSAYNQWQFQCLNTSCTKPTLESLYAEPLGQCFITPTK